MYSTILDFSSIRSNFLNESDLEESRITSCDDSSLLRVKPVGLRFAGHSDGTKAFLGRTLLVSLFLSFLLCEVGITTSISRGFARIKTNEWKVFRSVPGR